MLIMPIINKKRILNVNVGIKKASRVRENVFFDDVKKCDVIVNGKSFNDHKKNGDDEILSFIRNTSINYKRDYLITTDDIDGKYDVYRLPLPLNHVNDALDDMYTKAIVSMKYKNRDIDKDKGKYLSLDKIGLNNIFTDNKIKVMESIINSEKDKTKWPDIFKRVGVYDLVETINFLRQFDFTTISKSTILEDDMINMISSFDRINTKDTKSLNNYYDIAKSNKELYYKISYVNKILYGKSIGLIKSENQKNKKLVKAA